MTTISVSVLLLPVLMKVYKILLTNESAGHLPYTVCCCCILRAWYVPVLPLILA